MEAFPDSKKIFLIILYDIYTKVKGCCFGSFFSERRVINNDHDETGII